MTKKGFKVLILIIIILVAAITVFIINYPIQPTTENPSRAVMMVVKLPEPELKGNVSVEEAIQNRRSVREYINKSLNLKDVSQLMWAAQGITDKKNNFRSAPSSGRTYPLEIYLVVGKNGVEGIEEGVYHYNNTNHELEKLLNGDKRKELSKAANGQGAVENAPVDIVITGNYQRTMSKYGNNNLSIRFVHLEAGHAGENIYLEATARGLVTVSIGSFNDNTVKTLLNLPGDETTFYIFPVGFSNPE
jgi:SagB-type dehydrogenase family enzyme